MIMKQISNQCNFERYYLKRLVSILTITILTSSFLFCQEYKPFPTSHAEWSIFLISSCDNDSPGDTSLLRYYIQGDTVNNEVVYKKLMVSRGDTVNPFTVFAGGIREESKKIYYFGQGFLGYDYYEELLLYDFNVDVNDTISHDIYGHMKSIVLDIDSVMVDDHYRKRYNVDNGCCNHREDFIIEGMGSVLNGLLGHITMVPTCGYHYWEHVCYTENGQILYKNPVFIDCFAGVKLSGIELTEVHGIRIFPNPFKGYFEVSIPEIWENMTLKIYNISGQMISEMEIIDTHFQVTLDGPPGIYILSILDKNEQISRVKIVKE